MIVDGKTPGSSTAPQGDDTQVLLTQHWSERDILAEAEAVAHLGAWAGDITTNQLWWSDETYRIFGLNPQEFPATYHAFLQYVHPEDRTELERRVQAAVQGDEDYDLTHRVVRPEGEVRYVREHGSVARAADGTPLRMLGVVRDITEEVELQRERDDAIQALARSEEMHRLLAENAWDVVWLMGLDGKVTYVSPAIQRVRGLTPEEAMAQTFDEINTPESAANVSDYLNRLHTAIHDHGELPVFRGELEYYRKDGSIMLGELQVTPQVDSDGQVLQLIGVTRDITERRHFEDELNRLAVTDPLTGIWNRRQGEVLFTADLAEARRYGPPLSLLMIDIDHFKEINDTHGHQAGDQVLIELCGRISGNLRSSDVFARWGGEEFVILMRNCTIGDAAPLADKIRSLVAHTPFGGLGSVTVSIGAAELRAEDDLASWMRRADDALYKAKTAGRNAVCVEI